MSLKSAEKQIRKLVENIKLQERPGKNKLRFGYPIRLSPKQMAAAIKLNSLYERMVWGAVDDADHQSLSSEENHVLEKWIKNSIYGANVLEVGCGSGRFTIPLAMHAKKTTALDRENKNLFAMKKKMPIQLRKRVKRVCADFSKKFNSSDEYSAVIMIENVLGMNPRSKERKQMILNAQKALMKGGLLFIGFRVHPKIKEGYFYQSMPYQDIMGISMNWSVQHLLKELKTTAKKMKHLFTLEGSKRPAGGTMFVAVFEKKPILEK